MLLQALCGGLWRQDADHGPGRRLRHLLHYIKAVDALKGKDTVALIAKMREIPTDDPLFGKGHLRIDGRVTHDMYLYQVKTPKESKYPWDYYKLLQTIPGDQAFRPLAEDGCDLVK